MRTFGSPRWLRTRRIGVAAGLIAQLVLCLLGTNAHAATPNAGTTAARPLGQVLRADGTLRPVHGSFNPAGYRLALGSGGAPRFVKASAAASSGTIANASALPNSYWSENFGQVGLPSAVPAVVAVAVSGADVYVGGQFSTIEGGSGISYNNVAMWDGHGWHPLGAGTNGKVWAIAVSGANVYVGGTFTSAGGVGASAIARWNGSGWQPMGAGVTDTSSGTPIVKAIAVSGSTVYAGGSFDDAGQTPANSVAAWNGTQWAPLSSGFRSGSFRATVNALLVSGSKLYAGGSFAQTGTSKAFSLAVWNGAGWAGVGGAGVSTSIGNPGTVDALAINSSTLYVGGSFAGIGGTIGSGGVVTGATKVTNVAAFDGSTWRDLGGGTSGTVTSLIYWSGRLFAGGYFTGLGTDNAPIIGQWNGNTWSKVGPGLDGNSLDNAALASSSAGVYALGVFSTAGGGSIVLNKIGLWNGSTWRGLGLGLFGATATVTANAPNAFAVAASNHDLYAGGTFSSAGSVPAVNLAHFNGTSWSSMGPVTLNSGHCDAGGASGICAIAVYGNDVFIGGSFSQVAGVPASNVAMWNGSSWQALSTAGGNGVDGAVAALLVYSGKLWVGGIFNHAGGAAVSDLATWNLSTKTWAPVGGNPTYDHGSVNALAPVTTPPWTGSVVIGGSFSLLTDGSGGGAPVGGVAIYDPAKDNGSGPLSGYLGLQPNSATFGNPGVAGQVYAVYVSRLNIYIGGFFGTAGGVTPANGFAVFDLGAANGTGWSSPGGGVSRGAAVGKVYAITGIGSNVYLGGDFTAAGGTPAADAAEYTPSTTAWTALGSGLSDTTAPFVSALAPSTDGLYLGGEIGLAGGRPSSGLALWTATAFPTVSETASPASTTVGSPVTYTATIRNPAAASAPGMILTSRIPSSATFVSAAPSQGTCTDNSGNLSCSIGTLAPSGSATVTITLTPTATGKLPDSVTVTQSGSSYTNSASATTNVG